MTVPVTLKRFISPYDDAAPAGGRGLAGPLPVLPALPRGPPRDRGGQVLVRGPRALAPRLQALRHDHGRVREPLPRPVQHAPLPGAAGQRGRLPRPQRLLLHEPGRRAGGGHRGARAAVPRARRPLLRQLGLAARELARQDAPRDRRPRGDRLPAAARQVVPIEWIIEGRGLDNTLRPDRRRSTARSSSATRPGSTTSSSSTSATRPTSTSSASARRRSRGSPTWASRRWCRASRSTCSGPMTSCAGSRSSRSSSTWPTRSRAATWTTRWRRWPHVRGARRGSRPGRRAKDPWFNFSSGNGFYSSDRVWLDHLEIPLGFLRDYVRRVQAGEDIDRPTAAIAAERDRITGEYRALLADDEVRAAFDEKLGLSRLVFPYVENHNFYIEHWALSVFWRKIRELGQVLADAGLLAGRGRHLLRAPRRAPAGALRLRQRLGRPAPSRSARTTGRPRSSAGARIIDALEPKAPPPAMNEPPAVVTEPFTIMLYGITTDSVNRGCRARETTDELRACPPRPARPRASARVVERRVRSRPGPARARSSWRASRRRAGGRCSAASARWSPTSAG